MTNLPITTTTAQTTAASKQTANTADSADAQGSQPFGDVLAKQISAPATKDTKADDKLAVDALAQLGTDNTKVKKDSADSKKTDPAITDGTTTLPADMLAALLPQAMNNAAAGNITAGKSDSAGTPAADGKRGEASPKADIVATTRTDAAAQANSAAGRSTRAKEQSFGAALTESARRASANMELHTAARATASAQTGPQSNAAALAALQNNAAGIPAPVTQPIQMMIGTPVNQDKWSDEFTQKITWLASSNKDQTAELHLNPPQLGPLDVVIKVSGDQATALFTSPHAAVRDAIEQAMPKLRDMLADNGIMLGNATVSDQTPRDQGQPQSGTQSASVPTGNDIRSPSLSGNTTARASQISRHNGIVDTFA